MRALTGEHERGPWTLTATAADDAGAGLLSLQGTEARRRILDALRDDDDTVLEMRMAKRQRSRGVLQRDLAGFQRRGGIARQRLKRGAARSRERQEHRPIAVALLTVLRRKPGRRLLQNGAGVCATEAKGIDGGYALRALAREGIERLVDLDAQFIEANVGI